MNINIVYPPTIDFDWLVQRPQQLMKAFAALGIKVFYMNPGTRSVHEPGMTEILPNLFVFNGIDPLPYITGSTVFFFSCPAHITMAPCYHPDFIVFDYLDETVEEFAVWAEFKVPALTGADLVTASSASLVEDSLQYTPNTLLVPNGCDYEHFAPAARRNLPVPEDMQQIKPPIIGYFGAVASWLDFELLERIADRFNECNLVMIGPLYNVSRVPKRENIHWLGIKPYACLPNYAQLFDAAIIPFRITEMTRSVNPVKMWEYLAAGLPVVTTALPEASGLKEVYFSLNHEHFLANLSHALRSNNPSQKEQRMRLARMNTWKDRARRILEAIEACRAGSWPHRGKTFYNSRTSRPLPLFHAGTGNKGQAHRIRVSSVTIKASALKPPGREDIYLKPNKKRPLFLRSTCVLRLSLIRCRLPHCGQTTRQFL